MNILLVRPDGIGDEILSLPVATALRSAMPGSRLSFLSSAYAAPVLAHHAVSAEFDRNKPVSFTGTVKKVEWMNPHIYTHIEAKDATGKTVVYEVEGGAQIALDERRV